MSSEVEKSNEVEWMKACNRSACVEVSEIGIRDSKNPEGPALSLSAEAMAAFVQAVKNGDYNRVMESSE